jgi:hypothetical protein
MPSSGISHHVALVRTNIPSKCWFLQEPHGITSQKTAFFIFTAVKASNFAYLLILNSSFSLEEYLDRDITYIFIKPDISLQAIPYLTF